MLIFFRQFTNSCFKFVPLVSWLCYLALTQHSTAACCFLGRPAAAKIIVMKRILFIYLIFYFYSCTDNSINLDHKYYRIKEISLNIFQEIPSNDSLLSCNDSPLNLDNPLFIDISFLIEYCDSLGKSIKKNWMPSFGYNGIVDKIKSVDFLLYNTRTKGIKKIEYDTIDTKYNYIIKQSGEKLRLIKKEYNNRCFNNLEDMISNINQQRNPCTNLDGMPNNTLIIKVDNKKNNIKEYDRIIFKLVFSDYSLQSTARLSV